MASLYDSLNNTIAILGNDFTENIITSPEITNGETSRVIGTITLPHEGSYSINAVLGTSYTGIPAFVYISTLSEATTNILLRYDNNGAVTSSTGVGNVTGMARLEPNRTYYVHLVNQNPSYRATCNSLSISYTLVNRNKFSELKPSLGRGSNLVYSNPLRLSGNAQGMCVAKFIAPVSGMYNISFKEGKPDSNNYTNFYLCKVIDVSVGTDISGAIAISKSLIYSLSSVGTEVKLDATRYIGSAMTKISGTEFRNLSYSSLCSKIYCLDAPRNQIKDVSVDFYCETGEPVILFIDRAETATSYSSWVENIVITYS